MLKHLGYINTEGGPILVMDASLCRFWRGAAGDGTDYLRVCQSFDRNPNQAGAPISIGDSHAMLWEMEGAGTADAFINDHLVILRTWPCDPRDNTVPRKLAAEPLATGSELGQIQVPTGILVILWAAENGDCVKSLDVSENGRPAGNMAMGSAGLILRLGKGIYNCVHDRLETSLGTARRLHLYFTTTL